MTHSDPQPAIESSPPRPTIGTSVGAWVLGWSPESASFTADHIPDHVAGVVAPDRYAFSLGSTGKPIRRVGHLESRLGFALPDSVRQVLAADQAARPSRLRRPSPLAAVDRSAEPRIEWISARAARPEMTSAVSCPGQPTTTYWLAMARKPLLHSCTEPHLRQRLEILAAAPEQDPRTGHDWQRITYRLCVGDVVDLADDVRIPAGLDPTSDDAVEAVVERLRHPDEIGRLDEGWQSFIIDHGDFFFGGFRVADPPYPPGTRIALVGPIADAAGPTGTVVEALTDGAGEVTAYAWHPDRARLPGHPWWAPPPGAPPNALTWHPDQRVVITPADQVRETLADPDVGLNGWTPEVPLGFHSRVTYADLISGYPAEGSVLRAFPAPDGGLVYEIKPDSYLERAVPGASNESANDYPPDRTDGEPVRVPFDRVRPSAGAAFRSLQEMIDYRDAAGVAIQVGEVLSVGDQRASVTEGTDGLPILEGPARASPATRRSSAHPQSQSATPGATEQKSSDPNLQSRHGVGDLAKAAYPTSPESAGRPHTGPPPRPTAAPANPCSQDRGPHR